MGLRAWWADVRARAALAGHTACHIGEFRKCPLEPCITYNGKER